MSSGVKVSTAKINNIKQINNPDIQGVLGTRNMLSL